MKAIYSVAAAVAACFAIQSPAAAITILSSSAALSCPTGGCFSEPGRLTRVFGAEHFSGPTWIDTFVLDKKMLGKLAGETFKLTFWTADGQQVGDFQSFNLSVLGGEEVTLHGRAFEFDPSSGPLVVRLQFLPRGDAGDDVLAAMGFSRADFGGFGGGGFAAPAPVAGPFAGGFSAPVEEPRFLPVSAPAQPFQLDVTPMPEPAVWAEMVLGFMALGGLARSRRRVPVRA